MFLRQCIVHINTGVSLSDAIYCIFTVPLKGVYVVECLLVCCPSNAIGY